MIVDLIWYYVMASCNDTNKQASSHVLPYSSGLINNEIQCPSSENNLSGYSVLRNRTHRIASCLVYKETAHEELVSVDLNDV